MKLDKYKLITASLVGVTACSGLILTPTHADTPASSSSSANASITVSNTINLTLTGGDLVIDNLTPGNASDSNIITATITSNSPYGYHLSATTGTSSSTTSLVNTADSNFSFANLNANKASLNDFSDNTWGYSYSTDNGTSWISGDYGTALAGYNGLTLDNDDSGATGTTLYNNDSYAGSTAIKFKIGAKSSSTQTSGTYTGTVNFYAVTNPKPVMTIATATTMQEVDSKTVGGCPDTLTTNQAYELTDSRDGTVYHVARLADGNCWLLDNLALDLTNSTILDNMNESNTHASDDTLSYLKGVNARNPSTDPEGQYPVTKITNWTSGNYYFVPLANLTNKDRIPSDDVSQAGQYKIGGYYNYCAASAGSYCYGDASGGSGTSFGNATEDICPKGWRMPGGGDTINLMMTPPIGEYQNLFDIIDINANYRIALHLPLSGSFRDGSPELQGVSGYFWSSTRSTDEYMHNLTVYTTSVYPAYSEYRRNGYSVRCVLGS